MVAVLGGIGGERQGQQHLSLLGAVERRHHFARQRERSRHHTHHFVRHAIQRDGLAHNAGIGAITARPSAITEERGGIATGLVFVGDKQTPDFGAHAQHGQQIGRDADGSYALRLAFAGEVVVAADGDRHLLQTAMAGLDVEVLRGGKPVLGYAQSR